MSGGLERRPATAPKFDMALAALGALYGAGISPKGWMVGAMPVKATGGPES